MGDLCRGTEAVGRREDQEDDMRTMGTRGESKSARREMSQGCGTAGIWGANSQGPSCQILNIGLVNKASRQH